MTSDVVHPMVDAAPARKRLTELYDHGYSRRELYRLGLTRTTQERLRDGVELIPADIERTVLGIRRRSLTRGSHVPKQAALDLVIKWHEAGISYGAMARVTGISNATFQRLVMTEQRSVTKRVMEAILAHRGELDRMAEECR